jgi:hypothetical protein
VHHSTAASLESSSDQWIGNFLVHLVYPLKWIIFLFAFIFFCFHKEKNKNGRKELEETFFISHLRRLEFTVGISDSSVVTCEADKSIGVKIQRYHWHLIVSMSFILPWSDLNKLHMVSEEKQNIFIYFSNNETG